MMMRDLFMIWENNKRELCDVGGLELNGGAEDEFDDMRSEFE